MILILVYVTVDSKAKHPAMRLRRYPITNRIIITTHAQTL